MGHSVRIELFCGLPLPKELLARITFKDAAPAADLVLVDGCYQGELAREPAQLRLLDALPLPGTAGALDQIAGREPASPIPEVDFAQLFDRGVPFPADGALRIVVTWGNCHHVVREAPAGATTAGSVELHPSAPVRRYGSDEHVRCADFIGCDVVCSEGGSAGAGPIDCHTELPLGNAQATYGRIIALAGDYFAFFDADAARALQAMWPDPHPVISFLMGEDYRTPTLSEATQEEIDRTIAGFDRLSKLPARRRYLALAAYNFCHFAEQPADGQKDELHNLALTSYRYYHERALALATESEPAARRTDQQLRAALALDAFGAHFLTDLFASGHLRVPRHALGKQFGVFRGALRMARQMHDEDNQRGLLVTTRHAFSPRLVWRTYGDGELAKEDPQHGAVHRLMVQEGVRRSAAEVIEAWRKGTRFPEAQRAEALLPVPLAVGESLQEGDRLANPADLEKGSSQPLGRCPANHAPLYLIQRTESGESIVCKRTSEVDADSVQYESMGRPFASE